jgi:hypothetical protein
MTKEYRGTCHGPQDWRVDVVEDNVARPLPWRLDVSNHSPAGLSWGYDGSGPVQCALAILCDAVGVDRAKPLYQEFKRAKIARLEQDLSWVMTHGEVVTWVEERTTHAA